MSDSVRGRGRGRPQRNDERFENPRKGRGQGNNRRMNNWTERVSNSPQYPDKTQDDCSIEKLSIDDAASQTNLNPNATPFEYKGVTYVNSKYSNLTSEGKPSHKATGRINAHFGNKNNDHTSRSESSRSYPDKYNRKQNNFNKSGNVTYNSSKFKENIDNKLNHNVTNITEEIDQAKQAHYEQKKYPCALNNFNETLIEPQGDLSATEPQGGISGIEPKGDLSGIEPQGDLSGIEPKGDLSGIEPQGDLPETSFNQEIKTMVKQCKTFDYDRKKQKHFEKKTPETNSSLPSHGNDYDDKNKNVITQGYDAKEKAVPGELDQYWSNNESNFKKAIPQSTSNDKMDEENSFECKKSSKDYRESAKNVTVQKFDTKKKDDTFDDYDRKYRKARLPFERVIEVEGDLFSADKEYALAHCVAEDMNMSSGIALTFRQLFKNLQELLDQKEKQGGLAYLNHEGRYIYYLVTKVESSKKPTLLTMFKSVNRLKENMVRNGVKKLAIPRLGCGLDRLEWSEVKNMLEYVFKDTDIEIKVFNFQQNYGKTKQKLVTKSSDVSKSKSKKNKGRK